MSAEDQDQDQIMEDEEGSELGEELPLGEQKLKVLPGATDTAVSFQIEKEDHTLGNALRYLIMKNPDVEFCGYTIPHPSETKMNIRIQTYEDTNTTAFEALAKGLDDLVDACDVVTDAFTQGRDGFNAQKK